MRALLSGSYPQIMTTLSYPGPWELHETAAGDEYEAGNEGDGDLCYKDIEVSFLVSHLADAQQGDLCALVRQSIQSTGCDSCDTVDLLKVGTKFDISISQSVEGDAHTAGSGTACTCADCDGQHNEYQRGDVPCLQSCYQILEALSLLDDTAETDDDRGVQNGDTGVSCALVEDLQPFPDSARNLLPHQDSRGSNTCENGSLDGNLEAVEENQDDNDGSQSDAPVGKIFTTALAELLGIQLEFPASNPSDI